MRLNISYAEQMQTEGINLIFGIKGLKVHSKMCVIEWNEDGKTKRYGFISTGILTKQQNLYRCNTFTSHQQILKISLRFWAFLISITECIAINIQLFHIIRVLVLQIDWSRNFTRLAGKSLY
jgi:polyphosphate kinase